MRQGPTSQKGIENWNALVCFAPALRGFYTTHRFQLVGITAAT
uniref:Uncharacterized protein n=1 Tax=Klebsiella pneumoniae TaxID=573 RepID=A0A7S5L287_KLEPN|nr:hypothetical protein pKpnB199_00219 [Klebsiella pneumoniae]QGW58802.1 hypothetical protein pKpnB199_00336 [Klebsiella pneumoniae]QVI03122.1 hypothetical protein [Klebsiella pneumoniae]URZ92311.1 hypothetical protein [Klebsiella pneumoniae]URZ92882.1 hypothetical protein [Klebsiella pneumoniae]